MSAEYPDPDFALRHFLRDTVLLLGAPLEIADLLDKSKDGGITDADIDKVRNYNIVLLERCKTNLSNMHTIKLNTLEERQF